MFEKLLSPHNHEPEISEEEKENKIQEALNQETQRLLGLLLSHETQDSDMEELISNFGKDNPLFSQKWGELQDKTSLVLENQLKATNTPPESIKKPEISSQINFSQDIIQTNEKYGFLSQYIENITIGEQCFC